MAPASPNAKVQAILLDIEGTTTPLAFVYQILFPYTRAQVQDFLQRHVSSGAVQADLAGLRQEHAADRCHGLSPPELLGQPPAAALDALVTYLHWLMDRDRKSTPLKSLQGKIWQEGYQSGALRGQVFPDVPPALERWHRQGKKVGIFSSGSVLAQKLLFASTTAGDLTRFIDAYFDTTTGAKIDSESYRRIAAAWQRGPAEILFVSDATAELDAAREAGFETLLSLRPGNRLPPGTHTHPSLHTFDELFP